VADERGAETTEGGRIPSAGGADEDFRAGIHEAFSRAR
jgi:hypothetical protein